MHITYTPDELKARMKKVVEAAGFAMGALKVDKKIVRLLDDQDDKDYARAMGEFFDFVGQLVGRDADDVDWSEPGETFNKYFESLWRTWPNEFFIVS